MLRLPDSTEVSVNVYIYRVKIFVPWYFQTSNFFSHFLGFG